ncbi:hypothetical protein ACKUEM_25915, partial [Escherichia coli]|uniref:hypothetical protein n=1 Tax=Escherichia coli TaxID=562 RepID=UPI00390C523C
LRAERAARADSVVAHRAGKARREAAAEGEGVVEVGVVGEGVLEPDEATVGDRRDRLRVGTAGDGQAVQGVVRRGDAARVGVAEGADDERAR